MADLINLGITINIRPNGNMKGFLNGKVVLDSNMHNNTWKCNITELFKTIQNVQNESNNDTNHHYNKESMNDKTKYKRVKFSKFQSKFSRPHIKMLTDEDNVNESYINEDNNKELTKEEFTIQNKLNLLHKRSNHRGVSLLINDINRKKVQYNDISNTKLTKIHYPKAICNSCARAKSTKIPRLAKERKTITIKAGDPQVFDAGVISMDMTGPYVTCRNLE
jgi:hypothetical protein